MKRMHLILISALILLAIAFFAPKAKAFESSEPEAVSVINS